MNKDRDVGSSSSCRSRERSHGEDSEVEEQADAESRPSTFKLKYRTKDGQLMDIDGVDREEERIALASPIRSDGKRRFVFEEIDWNKNDQKRSPDRDGSKGSGGKVAPDQKK